MIRWPRSVSSFRMFLAKKFTFSIFWVGYVILLLYYVWALGYRSLQISYFVSLLHIFGFQVPSSMNPGWKSSFVIMGIQIPDPTLIKSNDFEHFSMQFHEFFQGLSLACALDLLLFLLLFPLNISLKFILNKGKKMRVDHGYSEIPKTNFKIYTIKDSKWVG